MKVYSFSDINMVISHPAVGQHVATGEGIGSLTTTMATERTSHDTAADGKVMVSKINGASGSHAMAIQQTSDLNTWLLKLYNYLDKAPSSEWADIMIIIRAPNMQELITSTGVSFKILAEKPFQAQGQTITWSLMAADIQQDSV